MQNRHTFDALEKEKELKEFSRSRSSRVTRLSSVPVVSMTKEEHECAGAAVSGCVLSLSLLSPPSHETREVVLSLLFTLLSQRSCTIWEGP